MVIEITAAAAGLGIGAGVMYRIQRRQRTQELKEIEKAAEDIMNEQTLQASASGEETLYGRIEHQLVRVQETLQGRTDEAEKSRDEIQKLISEIAHQMRTPLANLETYTGLLKERLEAAEEKSRMQTAGQADDAGTAGRQRKRQEQMLLDYTTALEESGRKLHFLTESFIKMSRLEQGIIQIRKEETDLLGTVKNVLGQIQSRAEEKQICLEISFPEKAVCSHDANWLGEAVCNILDNAVKYSAPGGRIMLSVLENEMFAKIRVRDFGLGIDPGEENQIFRRFYRGNRVTTQAGFGIGLYLAREIVSRHGGFLLTKRMEPGLQMEISIPKNKKDTGLSEDCQKCPVY